MRLKCPIPDFTSFNPGYARAGPPGGYLFRNDNEEGASEAPSIAQRAVALPRYAGAEGGYGAVFFKFEMTLAGSNPRISPSFMNSTTSTRRSPLSSRATKD
jgi:hypothetical protein